MARPKRTLPKPTFHKASSLACVSIQGRYIYLGHWGSPEVDEELRKMILELESVPQSMWNASGKDLIVRFLICAKQHYTSLCHELVVLKS